MPAVTEPSPISSNTPEQSIRQRSPEEQAAIRRRAMPVAVAGILCAVVGICLALANPVSPLVPPNILAVNLAFCAMLIGAGIFFYAKGTPRTGAAIATGIAAVLLGMVGTLIYVRQAVDSRRLLESYELSHVKAIAAAAFDYAKAHDGTYPADILVLLENHQLRGEDLQSPLGRRDELFNDFDAKLKNATVSRDDLLRSVETASDYLYVGSDLHLVNGALPADAKDVIVASSNTAVLRVSLALGFADGGGRFITLDEISDTLKACNDARRKMGLDTLKPPPIIQRALDEQATQPAPK